MARVGAYHGLGPFGTYDMAGNAKQWCLNAVGEKRFILGGAWNEQPYMFLETDAMDPFARSANFGFRCVKYQEPPAVALLGPIACGTGLQPGEAGGRRRVPHLSAPLRIRALRPGRQGARG